MVWNIVISDSMEKTGKEILRKAGLVDDCSGIPMSELLQIIQKYDALIVRSRTQVTKELFNNANRLKVVGRAGVGVDNIDLYAAKARNVIVVNAPTAASISVSELTLGFMFSLSRQIPRANADVKSGKWPKDDFQGSELFGKTLGIIGVGNIGSTLAKRGSALGMRVLGYDYNLTDEVVKSRRAEPVSLNVLFQRSDFISVHVPLNEQTRGMINHDAIGQMKRGVYVICTARGGIIDENALLTALESGQAAGAALDVFDQEPPGKNDLALHPKVIATPHIGAQTREAQKRASEDIAHEVIAALRGEALRWRLI